MSEVTKTPMESFTDFLGNEVRIGDYVVYATTSGRSPVQKLGRVEKIWSERKLTYRWDAIAREVNKLKVGVRTLDDGRGFTREWVRTEEGGFTQLDHGTPAERLSYPMHENMVRVEPPNE